MEKAKLLLVLYVFSTPPHCQEFETGPKQKKEMEFTLDNSYHFKWEKIDKTPINKSDKKEEWYFLEIEVLKPRTN